MAARPRAPAGADERGRRLAALAGETKDPLSQGNTQRALADLLASAPATRDEAQQHYEAALRHARAAGDRNETAASLWALGRFLSDVRPVDSRKYIDEALLMAVRSGSANATVYAWRQQMRLAWKTFPRDKAIVESFRALDAIETLRALQDADLARAAVMGAWTTDYYWLMGRLLDGTRRTPRPYRWRSTSRSGCGRARCSRRCCVPVPPIVERTVAVARSCSRSPSSVSCSVPLFRALRARARTRNSSASSAPRLRRDRRPPGRELRRQAP